MSQLAGTIGLVATRGFAAGCIRLATRSHENHIIIADGTGRAFQGAPGGVDLVPEDSYPDTVWLDHLPLSGGQRISMLAWLHSETGVRYNWPAIIVFGLRTFVPWLPHRVLDRWADRRPNQICSELAVNALRYAGIDPWPGRLAATIPPAAFVPVGLRGTWT